MVRRRGPNATNSGEGRSSMTVRKEAISISPSPIVVVVVFVFVAAPPVCEVFGDDGGVT